MNNDGKAEQPNIGPLAPLDLERIEQASSSRILATTELEGILCSARTSDTLARIMLPATDSWSVRFPDLTSLPDTHGERRQLSVCIATEDIVGPVRNGGIGTTYAALAEGLAKAGYHTTILYLRGNEIETGSLEQWIDHYAAMNVKFVPVPAYSVRDGFRSGADRWLRAPYNMLHYLLEHPMDVVHVSEWRGSGYLSLMAKQQGLAFQDTLFIVKTSSPWLWNRLYGSQSLERVEDLAKINAERKSVELADMVIGGSLHLLRWMLSQGYQLPRNRTFVQPNFVRFDHLEKLINKRQLPVGSRLPIDEIVFFGRLEARKGLFTFCQAIRRLIRQGVQLPPAITFMGKPGAKLTARPDQSIIEYIEAETKGWPVKVEIITDFQQHRAIEYLLSGARLAVMPSAIENSSMAVYEAAICGIPFIASAVGGTPELVRAEDHAHVLCEPHPIPLADLLTQSIRKGGYIAGASFDNQENIDVWLRFHDQLARGLRTQISGIIPKRVDHLQGPLGACIYYAGDIAKLESTLASLQEQEVPFEHVLIAVDAPERDAALRVEALLARIKMPCTLVETFDEDAGLSFNSLAAQASDEFLLFMWEGTRVKPQASVLLRKIAALTDADVLNFFYREIDPAVPGRGPLKGVVIGSVTEAFFRNEVSPQPLLVRRSAFQAVGGFTSDYRVLSFDQEFIAKAQLAGLRCETALVELASVIKFDSEWLSERCYDETVSSFRAIRPQLAAAPLAFRDLLLMAKGAIRRGPVPKAKRLPDAVVPEKETVSHGIKSPTQVPLKSPLIVAKGNNGIIVDGTAGSTSNPPKILELNAKTAAKQAEKVSFDRILDAISAPEVIPFSSVKVSPAPAVSKGGDNNSAKQSAVGARKNNNSLLLSLESMMPTPETEGAKANGNLDRRVLFVRDGIVHGWALDPADPKRNLIVEALEGDQVVAEAIADEPLELPSRMRRSDVDGHAYSLRLFPSWLPKSVQRGSRIVDLRIRDGGYIARKREIFAPGAPIEGSKFQAFCDPNDDGVIVGWAWMPSDPDRKLDVAALIDGRFIGRAKAEEYRDDLVAHGIGNGDHGFHLPINFSMLKGGSRSIEVVIADHGLRLKRSPMTIQGRKVVLGPSSRRWPWSS